MIVEKKTETSMAVIDLDVTDTQSLLSLQKFFHFQFNI